MNPTLIEKQIQHYTVQHGGNERRFYLGMSGISRPESELLRDMLHGSAKPSLERSMLFALGYETEANVRARLEKGGFSRPDSSRELVADFDSRFRGHTDGEWSDGSLLEIKSTLEKTILDIEQKGKVPTPHYQQVQLYLHHGGYSRAYILYFARDTGRVLVRHVLPNKRLIDELNDKARRILAEYDRYQPDGRHPSDDLHF